MLFSEAMEIINKKDPVGFRVHYEKLNKGMLESGYFPEKHEPLIDTEETAWILAREFACKTYGRYVNIYVIDASFNPVPNYQLKKIVNRSENMQ